MHFLGQASPTAQAKFCIFFLDLKKAQGALKNIQNFKICKKSQCEYSQISKSSKKQNSYLCSWGTLLWM